MRTITLYKYSELSESAKPTAIEEIREEMQEHESHSAYEWAIDDCSLFEPPYAEMVALFGEDYYDRNGNEFVFKNKRKGIEFDDYFETVQITDALEITNQRMFRTWLGVPEIFHDLYIEIMDWNGRTIIEMENPFMSEDPRHEAVKAISNIAAEKFEAHVSSIAKSIAYGIEEYFSDENVENRIEESNFEFNEQGNIVNL
jgi:hypothetical protein